MLLSHIGYTALADKLQKALEICSQTERKIVITSRADGATGKEFTDYVLKTICEI